VNEAHREAFRPEGTNLLGDALGESRQHFRKVLSTLDQLIAADRLDEARRHQPKLEALGQELRRLLNPGDPVDRRTRDQIDRDLARVQKSLKKGWGGSVGRGIAAMVVGGILGIVALIVIFIVAFG